MKSVWQRPEFQVIQSDKMRNQRGNPDFEIAFQNAMDRKRKVVKCAKCGTEFKTRKSDTRKFCGKRCADEGMVRPCKKHQLPKNSPRAEVDRWRYKNEPAFRLRHILKRRMQRFLSGVKTSGSMERLLGCTLEQLKAHIEKQFRPGMTWDNQGVGEGHWNLDHILPIASFEPTWEQQRVCWNFQNLRPLWAVHNLRKGATIESGKSQLPLPLCHS